MVSKLSGMAIVSAISWWSLSGKVAIAGEHHRHTAEHPGLKCMVTTDRQTVRDAINYPGAYESGYQQGTEARVRGGSLQAPSHEGEIARGYIDGYQLKPYSAQVTTIPTYNKVRCGCRTRILKDTFFGEEIDATCKSDREEIVPTPSDAYHANAYNDGYREGIASKTKHETYKARSAGGEFARGFEDGYFGRRNTGQRYTELPAKDYRCKCSLLVGHNNVDIEY
jgi:hypothetical protein